MIIKGYNTKTSRLFGNVMNVNINNYSQGIIPVL